MAKKRGVDDIHRLNALFLRNTKKPGCYADGGNLYLNVAEGGAKTCCSGSASRGAPEKWGSAHYTLSIWMRHGR